MRNSLRTFGRIATIGGALATVEPAPADAQQWRTRVVAGTESTRPALPNAYNEHLFLRQYGPARQPIGHKEFCERFPTECAAHLYPPAELVRADASEFSMLELSEVVQNINSTVKQELDHNQPHGKAEKWDVAIDIGDCEDFALRYQHELRLRGWASHNLLITVVRIAPTPAYPQGELHAVLVVRTKNGEYVLDNRKNKALPIEVVKRQGYTFIMRQSFINPNEWVALNPKYAR